MSEPKLRWMRGQAGKWCATIRSKVWFTVTENADGFHYEAHYMDHHFSVSSGGLLGYKTVEEAQVAAEKAVLGQLDMLFDEVNQMRTILR